MTKCVCGKTATTNIRMRGYSFLCDECYKNRPALFPNTEIIMSKRIVTKDAQGGLCHICKKKTDNFNETTTIILCCEECKSKIKESIKKNKY